MYPERRRFIPFSEQKDKAARFPFHRDSGGSILLKIKIHIHVTLRQSLFQYHGGNISPGVQMRFRALHDYTAALPLCESCEDQTLLGRSTVEAIRQGVMNGIAFEIEGYIARLFPEIDALSIIFTGGDAKFFVKRIKNTIFAHCDLVFLGLNRILEYNASEESRR